jgi:hypothetical protein
MEFSTLGNAIALFKECRPVFEKIILYLLNYVRQHPEDAGTVGLAWANDRLFFLNTTILAKLLRLAGPNSVKKNLTRAGFETSSAGDLDQCPHVGPGIWKLCTHPNFPMQVHSILQQYSAFRRRTRRGDGLSSISATEKSESEARRVVSESEVEEVDQGPEYNLFSPEDFADESS